MSPDSDLHMVFPVLMILAPRSHAPTLPRLPGGGARCAHRRKTWPCALGSGTRALRFGSESWGTAPPAWATPQPPGPHILRVDLGLNEGVSRHPHGTRAGLVMPALLTLHSFVQVESRFGVSWTEAPFPQL